MICALVIEIAYDLDIESHWDKSLEAGEPAMEYVERVMVPGGFLVDMFPIRSFCPWFLGSCSLLLIHTEVKYVPGWFPGAGLRVSQ